MLPANHILLAWIPVMLGLFLVFPPRRAVIICVIASWLVLPVKGGEYNEVVGMFRIEGFVDLHKATLTSFFILIAACVFDTKRVTGFKPHWLDLPIVLWCLCPIPTGMTYPLSTLYAGVAGSINQIVIFGIPYFIGRLYFSNAEGMKELAIALIIGTLLYIPLMLIEVRLSPQFHNWFYGYHQSGFEHHAREGMGGLTNYRPKVFLHGALMLGIWMTTATLLAYWLWLTKSVTKIFEVPILVIVVVLFLGTLLANAIAALALLIMGVIILTMVKQFRTAFLLPAAIIGIILILGVRTTNFWTGDEFVALVADVVNEKRAQSVQSRFENEAPIIAKAQTRPLFGSDAHFLAFKDGGDKVAIPDSKWVITFGRYGYFGLGCLVLMALLPAVVYWWKYPPKRWTDTPLIPGAAFAVLLVIYMIDNLANDFVTPVYIMMGGGLTGLVSMLHVAKAPRKKAVVAPKKIYGRKPASTQQTASAGATQN